eukprot:7510583-Alexandrium_andersonii.AAC.1
MCIRDRYYCVLPRTTAYYHVPPRTTACYRVLPRTTAYYRVLLQTTTYYRGQPRTTELRASQGAAGICRNCRELYDMHGAAGTVSYTHLRAHETSAHL